MIAPEPPIVRSFGFGDVGVTVRLPSALRRLRPRRARGVVPDEILPVIELPAESPSLSVEKQDPERWIQDWVAPPEFWDEQHRLAAAREAEGAPVAEPDLASRVAALAWYHTIELPGDVATPGLFDHRPLVPHYGLPASLTGKRALDVATFDGFWAFELERRGADVSAVDLATLSELDWATGMRELFLAKNLDRDPSLGFYVASEALQSNVKLEKTSIYSMSPEKLGVFDFVHIADVLLHLRDPIRALERVRSMCAPGAQAHIVDAFDPTLEGRQAAAYEGGWNFCTWWVPSLDTLAQMVLDAGFSGVRLVRTFRANTADGPGRWRAILVATP